VLGHERGLLVSSTGSRCDICGYIYGKLTPRTRRVRVSAPLGRSSNATKLSKRSDPDCHQPDECGDVNIEALGLRLLRGSLVIIQQTCATCDNSTKSNDAGVYDEMPPLDQTHIAFPSTSHFIICGTQTISRCSPEFPSPGTVWRKIVSRSRAPLHQHRHIVPNIEDRIGGGSR
jgi:hypothetical protein